MKVLPQAMVNQLHTLLNEYRGKKQLELHVINGSKTNTLSFHSKNTLIEVSKELIDELDEIPMLKSKILV